jgi:hypothetical protein
MKLLRPPVVFPGTPNTLNIFMAEKLVLETPQITLA